MLDFDIETIPLAASMNAAYNPDDHSPPGNYGTDARTKWHEKNEDKWRSGLAKQCSLNPRLGRIVCISTSRNLWYAETEADEKPLLEGFWADVHSEGGRICTFGGLFFDARFTVIRSLIHGLTPSVPVAVVNGWFRKYSFEHHLDVKAALLNFDTRVAGEGLDEWCAAFGLPGKPGGVDGSDVHFLFENGQHDDIKGYCTHDRVSTGKLREIIAPFFVRPADPVVR